MENNIKIGCSSFYNSKWRNIFYPEDLPSKKWFDYYCEHFSTFEINATFYKFPTSTILKNWYTKSPSNFCYSVKVPKEITHYKKLKDCKELIDEFYALCDFNLKEKLGCILFQLPPSYSFSKENLQNILSNLNPKYKNVIEFRHKSWWSEEVLTTLTKNKISFCSISHPTLPKDIILNTPIIYVRLHGQEKLYYSEYQKKELESLKESICSINKGKETYIYFNNTASQAGILNAMTMKSLLR